MSSTEFDFLSSAEKEREETGECAGEPVDVRLVIRPMCHIRVSRGTEGGSELWPEGQRCKI